MTRVQTRPPLAALALLLVASVTAIATPAGAQAAAPAPITPLAREILAEMVRARTTEEGDLTPLSESLAARFRAAGFATEDVMVLGAGARNRNLVVRLRGRDRTLPPRIFAAHLDVVGAEPALWTTDPWQLVEKDGLLHGRGVMDDKGPAAALAASFLDLRRRSVVPARDLLLLLTAGEESGKDNGIEWLVANRRDLIAGEFIVVADAGGGEIADGKRIAFGVQGAEKVYTDFTLTARGPGGHSSVPSGRSPIDRLATAIDRLSRHTFPTNVNPVVREFLARRAPLTPGAQGTAMAALARDPGDVAAARTLSADPGMNALLRTTCIATILKAGTAPNAIPAEASANVNCRVIPGESPDTVLARLRRVIDAPDIEITIPYPMMPSPPSVMPAPLARALDETLAEVYGPLPVIPYMEMGATDGVYLRNAGQQVIGIIGLFVEDQYLRTLHGNDERLPAAAYDQMVVFTRALVGRLAR
ncbi:MAG: M20/M25/M40 family metallo-hydrolase [Gemmatimonadaceae bacterium]|jgi:acetylornithine deacetylase/succinyl-diaminopimelate desuccinylase-like protein|nr:M20/M25/M40 family metallo-hydrolase [Gemmatimonadaceae bacterium]